MIYLEPSTVQNIVIHKDKRMNKIYECFTR